MHTAPPIWAIGADADCRVLATGAADKTVRLWSMPDGKLKKVVRLPIGEGDAGRVYGTALSPDGRWLAAGGSDAAFEKTRASTASQSSISATARCGASAHSRIGSAKSRIPLTGDALQSGFRRDESPPPACGCSTERLARNCSPITITATVFLGWPSRRTAG